MSRSRKSQQVRVKWSDGSALLVVGVTVSVLMTLLVLACIELFPVENELHIVRVCKQNRSNLFTLIAASAIVLSVMATQQDLQKGLVSITLIVGAINGYISALYAFVEVEPLIAIAILILATPIMLFGSWHFGRTVRVLVLLLLLVLIALISGILEELIELSPYVLYILVIIGTLWGIAKLHGRSMS